MLISVVTVARREDPRLEATARCLLGGLLRTPADVELKWIVVDLREGTPEARAEEAHAALDAARDAFGDVPRMSLVAQALEKRESLCRALNIGIAASPEGSYVALLEEGGMPNRSWVRACLDAALQGKVLRYQYERGLSFPALSPRGEIERQYAGPLVRCEESGMKGQTGAYPRQALFELGGFDESFTGEFRLHEADLAFRARRLGLAFVTTPRAAICELTWPEDRPRTNTNETPERKKLNQTVRDRARTLPAQEQPPLEELAPRPPGERRRPEPERPLRPAHRAPAAQAAPAPSVALDGPRASGDPDSGSSDALREFEENETTPRDRPPLRPGTYWDGKRYVDPGDEDWSQEAFNATLRGEVPQPDVDPKADTVATDVVIAVDGDAEDIEWED